MTKRDIKRIAIRKAFEYKINPLLVLAIIEQESRFKVDAKGPYGELGLMQINPSAHPAFDIKRAFDPEYNIDYGVRYLKTLMRKYKKIEDVISAYNAGKPIKGNYDSYVVPVLQRMLRMFITLEFLT